MNINAIVTMPPYAPYLDEVLRHPVVSGIRLNTVMPIKRQDTLESVLGRLHNSAKRLGKDFFIDLKYRQLRTVGYAEPPFTEIALSHEIKVPTPVTAFFQNGKESATVLEVDGNRLIMQEGPKRMVGEGESVNIVHPLFSVIGTYTEKDRAYVSAAKNLGIKQYMLSFVESQEDIDSLIALDQKANIVAKIESQKGLSYIRNSYDGKTRLMCARGDLFIELDKPHRMLAAEEDILSRNRDAIVASRIFPSLAYSLEPSCEDINDVDNLLRIGYRTVMLGDDICQHRDRVISALNLFEAIAEAYNRKAFIRKASPLILPGA